MCRKAYTKSQNREIISLKLLLVVIIITIITIMKSEGLGVVLFLNPRVIKVE
jgi:hypothetical protein